MIQKLFNMKSLFLIRYFAIILIVSTANVSNVLQIEGVHILREPAFDEFIQTNQFVLVQFYAPWSIECQNISPEYSKAAQELSLSNNQIKLAKVNIAFDASLGNRYKITKYPTFMFFIDGKTTSSTNDLKTSDEIISWVNVMIKKNMNIISIKNTEELEKLIDDTDVIVAFFGDDGHEKFDVFQSCSKKFDGLIFISTTNEEIRIKYGQNTNKLISLIRMIDNIAIDFEGEFNQETLENFIKNNKSPDVIEFDEDYAQKIFLNTKPVLFLLVESKEAGNASIENFKEINTNINTNILFVIVNIDTFIGNKLADFIGVHKTQLPAVRLVVPNPGSQPNKYMFNDEITIESIQVFLNDYKAGNLNSYLKSEDIPQTQDGPVRIVVGKNFEEIVFKSDDDVLINIYTPWCRKCQIIDPHFNEAAKKLQGLKNLVVAKIDATQNEIKGIQEYSKILFYPAHQKKYPIEFDGEMTSESIVSWVKNHAVASKLANIDEL